MSTKERIVRYLKFYNIKQGDFCKRIGVAKTYIASIRSSISPDKLSKITQEFPDLNIAWLLTGEGEMLKSEDKPIISYTEGVPYYDVDFQAGFDIMASPDHDNPEYLIKMPRYDNATLWCNASGDSMEPEINNGDAIALLRIEDFRFLSFDYIYAFVTKNDMRTIKRIGRGATENSYRLIPTNKAYEEQDLPIDMILQVYRVLGCVKRF